MKTIYSLFLLAFFTTLCFSQTIELNQVANTFNEPVEMAHANDNRLFIVEKSGIIKILNNDGSVNATPFLDISSIVGSGGERGLLGLAFAPDYDTTGRFYVNYTDNTSTNQPNTIIARYTVSSNPDIANTTETILLTIPQPYSNHNGGKLAFGQDGYLYIATGDGGSGGDPGNRSQNTSTLLGKLLRIDVSGATFSIPSDNPYASQGGLPEIYAIGLRNPWKLSFDRANGDLWIADVGQSSYEEINKSIGSGTPGDNYGWRCYEGMHDFNNQTPCPPMSLTKTPVSEYSYGNGPNGFRCSITGGFIYRGNDFSSLTGKYFFADYCSGEIGMLTENGSNWTMDWQVPNIDESWVSFGEDNLGELYIVGGNAVYKLSDPNLSLDDNQTHEISIYPNPTNDILNINFGSNNNVDISTEISIYDLQGKKVKAIGRNTKIIQTVNTSELASGFYILQIKVGNGAQTTHKLVIN